MTFLELNRMEAGEFYTLGVLLINKQLFCYILEPPKKANEKNISCIPTGQYFCKSIESAKFNCMCLSVLSVYRRSGILFHPGNSFKDTTGCLLPGAYTGFEGGSRFVYKSRDTLKALMSEINSSCHLTIREKF